MNDPVNHAILIELREDVPERSKGQPMVRS